MNMHTPAAYTRQMRRARTVYGALRAGTPDEARNAPRPKSVPMLLELAALAAFVAAAGIIALRAWLALAG